MATTNQMYQTLIIEHDRSPRNYKRLDAPTHHAEGRNPLCGDEVSLDLTLDADGVAVSSDFYLRLTGDGGRMLKGLVPVQTQHPTTHMP